MARRMERQGDDAYMEQETKNNNKREKHEKEIEKQNNKKEKKKNKASETYAVLLTSDPRDG